MNDPLVVQIRRSVCSELAEAGPAVLAVSGGVDSMVLLDAALATRPPHSFRIATFDHASGLHSGRAVDLVERVALGGGLSVIVGRSRPTNRPSEAAWREARLGFLRATAAEYRAVLCTGHSRDDQVETVLFREMRGAGARGLAGLRAGGTLIRPILAFSRAEIEQYACVAGVIAVDDPTNESRTYARNRIRLELLPALRARTPSIEETLLEIGERAARWRVDVDVAIDALIDFEADAERRALDVAVDSLKRYDPAALAVIWPALLARIGIMADWRGTRRLVEFTTKGSSGRRIQLSGGWVVFRRRATFDVRPGGGTAERLGEPALPFSGEHD